jgi:hypothetical protein
LSEPWAWAQRPNLRLKVSRTAADARGVALSSNIIRTAIIIAVICGGYVGYRQLAGSGASPQNRAAAYLVEQERSAAKAGHGQFQPDSITCGSAVAKPTRAEAARLGSDVRLVDCAATTVTGQAAVICVGVGGKLPGNGVGLLSLNHHCADVNNVFLAYAGQ